MIYNYENDGARFLSSQERVSINILGVIPICTLYFENYCKGQKSRKIDQKHCKIHVDNKILIKCTCMYQSLRK